MIKPPSDGEDSRSFLMGQFRADFPSRLRYTTNHMWAEALPDAPTGALPIYRFGLTAYAVRLLQDVYFLDWVVEPQSKIARRQSLGSIESKKAESDLFAPTAGELIGLNAAVLADPSLINVDLYAAGWLLEIAPEGTVDLLDVEAYLGHLEQAWPLAQRTIKGQI